MTRIQSRFLEKSVSHVQVIEFQKRGLPHAHLLIHLAIEDKLQNSDDVDKLISAEIPDPVSQPRLYEIANQILINNQVLMGTYFCLKLEKIHLT